MAAIRVVNTTLVHPSTLESGISPLVETSLPLTYFDIFWVPAPPVQRVFFYRLEPGAADVDAIVSNLRDSLSRALSAFFPLAGKLQLAPGTANRYELHYRPGDAVTFTVSESDDDVDSLATDEPRGVSNLAPLASLLPAGGAVLAVQATVLNSAARPSGLALGVTVHHASCDGAASTHFLHTWAATAGARPLPAPPVIDRTLISDPTGLYDLFCPKSAAPPTTTEDTAGFVATPVDDKVFATFVLSRAHLQRVKDTVAATKAATRGVAPPPRCSSLVATLGLVWSCYHRAKPVDSGRACLLFPVDHRSRLTPPVPNAYLGNCVGAAIAFASKPDLAGVDGLWAACAAVAASIEEVSTERMDQLGQRVMEAAATGAMLTVAGSPRFKVYELDFGFGRPAKVDIVSVAKTGAMAVAESRAGDGGMEVGVSLPPDGMTAFRKCLDDSIAELDQHAGAQ